MSYDIPTKDEAAFERIEQHYQQSYFEALSDCLACLFQQKFSHQDIKKWHHQLASLYHLNDHFLDDVIKQAEHDSEVKNSIWNSTIYGTTHLLNQVMDKAQDSLPFNLGHQLFSEPLFQSAKMVTQVSGLFFSATLGNSMTRFLVDKFCQDSNKNSKDAAISVADSLEADGPLSRKIFEESQTISNELMKLFMFREMLLQGKISQNDKEQDVRKDFIKRAALQKASDEQIAAIVEIYFIQELNRIFEHSFQNLFQLQDELIVKDQSNDFDRWLSQLFNASESRQLFTRQIQIEFMQATRDFFLEKQHEKSFLGRHPILISMAVGLTIGLITITTTAMICHSLATLPLMSAGIASFAISLTLSILLIKNINRIRYARSTKNRQQIGQDIEILNQNITHIQHKVDNTKETEPKELAWLDNFKTINANLFHNHTIMLGHHTAWLREYASRYRHAKTISNDLRGHLHRLMTESNKQSIKITEAFQKNDTKVWSKWLNDTHQFLIHPANASAVEAFELRLKIREQVLNIASQLDYVPPELKRFYAHSLKGNDTDLSYLQHFQQSGADRYNRLCKSANTLYQQKEAHLSGIMRFEGDSDYRKLLQLPTLNHQTKISPKDMSTYLRNSLHFLLSLNNPIRPGLGLDPLNQPILPSDEFILYRMLLFRELANIYHLDTRPEDLSNRLSIESFVERVFEMPVKEVFDDIMNQSYYIPNQVTAPTVLVNGNEYVIEQLGYVLDAVTLDMACHTKPLTPLHILRCYASDYLDAIEHDKSIKFIALNTNENDLAIQQSHAFMNYINKLIEDTDGLIQYLANNCVPEAYLRCYQFNVFEQLMRVQLDIIIQSNQIESSDKDAPLHQSWQVIDDFMAKSPFPIDQNTALYRLFQLYRQSPSAIKAFTFEDEDIAEFKQSIRTHMLPNKPSVSKFSLVGNTKQPTPKSENPDIYLSVES